MIQVSRGRAFRHVQYLIQQSQQGNHVLFPADDIRRVLKAAHAPISLQDAVQHAIEVEPHLERLLSEPSLEAKRAYLESLDRKTYEKVVLTYFNIVENSLLENSPSREDLH